MPDLLEFVTNDWMPVAIAVKLGWLIQLGLLIHVFRTGRPYWWYWVLLGAPALGGIVYVCVEILPELGQPNGATLLARLKPRSWRIHDLREELEEADIVKTRLALAAELSADGKAQEAHATAVDALRGVFRDDPLTQAAVARHKVDTARWAEALALLDQINVKADRMLALEVALLRARALLGCQRWPEAEGVLRSLQGQLIGEEPRYFLALALQGLGRPNEAIDLWRDILKRYRKGGPAWRRSEKRWFRLAQQRLEETKAS